MRSTQLTVLAAAWTTGAAAAAGVIPMSIAHTRNRAISLAERSDTYAETLTNNLSYGGYFASISVGTPGQAQDVILDTGSSDLWVLGSDSSACAESTAQTSGARRRQSTSTSSCLSTFDSSSSTSFSNLSLVFDIEYVDGSAIDGYYFTDTVEIGGATIDTVQMGLADESDVTYGIAGIGFPSNEAAATPYPNLIDRFYEEGLIGSRAYSLYLDDLDSSTGSILFGGVDSDKYSGSLIAVPIIKDSTAANYTSFSITLSSLAAVSSSDGTVSTNYSVSAQSVILDSGTTLTYLPETLAESIMDTFGATYDESYGYATVACSVADSDLALEYQFGGSDGPIITVAASELVLSTGTSRGGGSAGAQAEEVETCAFGVSMSSSVHLLGDTFLRSAYTVYDLDSKVVALAQTNFNSTGSSVSAIESGSSIPGVSATASSVVASETGTTIGSSNEESGASHLSSMTLTSLASILLGATFGAFVICA